MKWRRAGRGFSMIELLVVIFLIAFMLSALAVVFIRNARTAKIKAAQVQLQRLGVALAQYYADFRDYPPDTGYGLKPESGTQGKTCYYDAGSLFRYLGRPLTWMKTRADGTQYDAGTFGPYLKFQDSELKKYKDDFWGDSSMVVDPWGSRVGYIGDPKRKIHNRDGVDLYSAGPDQKTASDDKDFDHKWPAGFTHDNQAYDGQDNDGDGVIDNATELGYAVLNGCLTPSKKDKNIDKNNPSDPKKSEQLDDINNWDPQ